LSAPIRAQSVRPSVRRTRETRSTRASTPTPITRPETPAPRASSRSMESGLRGANALPPVAAVRRRAPAPALREEACPAMAQPLNRATPTHARRPILSPADGANGVHARSPVVAAPRREHATLPRRPTVAATASVLLRRRATLTRASMAVQRRVLAQEAQTSPPTRPTRPSLLSFCSWRFSSAASSLQ